VLEVYREPVPAGPAPDDAWHYRERRVLLPTATVTPLAAPRSRIRVASLLP